MKRLFVILLLIFSIAIISFGQPNAWINEFHYDNAGTDAGEFVEVVIEDPGTYTLSLFQIDLYNGSNGTSYNTKTLDNFTIGNTIGNFTFFTYNYPVNGIQNDYEGICLSYNGIVIPGQFLSYENSFVATNGPAVGMISTDIGAVENSATPTGYSLQLAGTGLQYSDFSWNSPDFDTPGSINICQLLSSGSAVNLNLFISEISNPDDIANAKFVELYNSGTTPIDFCKNVWYLSCESNGGSQTVSVRLDISASLAPGETWVIAGNNPNGIFQSTYGYIPDQISNIVSGSGDDSYMLYYGGDHNSGTLIDIFGEIGTIGTYELWQYDNSKATRKKHIVSPNIVWTADEWVIIPAVASEMTPDWHNEDLTWTGNNSSVWSNTSNWNDGSGNPSYPPDAGCDIIIPVSSNDPIISGRASTNNMQIDAGAVVTITPTNFLVTGSEIDNQSGTSGLIVQSDINSHDGMLLLGSGTTQATIQRYLSDDRSHFISAPITNATADNLFQNHNPEVYLYEYHEWDGSYNYLVPTSTPMPSGKGFSTWVDEAGSDYIVAEFDGEITSDDYTFNSATDPSITYSGAGLGWNLMGNPYPVPLNWKQGSWNSNNLNTEQTVWIWEPEADDTPDVPDGRWLYETASGVGGNFNGIIPSGQAFFVLATGSNPSITIPANARTVYFPETTYYKSGEIRSDSSENLADYIKITAMNEQDEEEVFVSFNEYGTEDFDNGWDASKLRNSYSSVCLYIPKETRDQCIEHLPTLIPEEERIVEVAFETTVNGEHSFMIDATYMPDTDITLEDRKYNQMQNMEIDSIYTFVAFTDDDPNRFRIHFNKTVTGIDFEDYNHQKDKSIQIYSYGKNVYIKKDDINTSGYVMLYDMYGREVLSQNLETTSLIKIPVQLNNNYLVVKVVSDNKVFTSKVYIN